MKVNKHKIKQNKLGSSGSAPLTFSTSSCLVGVQIKNPSIDFVFVSETSGWSRFLLLRQQEPAAAPLEPERLPGGWPPPTEQV